MRDARFNTNKCSHVNAFMTYNNTETSNACKRDGNKQGETPTQIKQNKGSKLRKHFQCSLQDSEQRLIFFILFYASFKITRHKLYGFKLVYNTMKCVRVGVFMCVCICICMHVCTYMCQGVLPLAVSCANASAGN